MSLAGFTGDRRQVLWAWALVWILRRDCMGFQSPRLIASRSKTYEPVSEQSSWYLSRVAKRESGVTSLFMSDIPSTRNKSGESDDLSPRFKLPPPPEDSMVMMGDLLSIFVYGFSDHLICHDLAMAQSADLLASPSGSTSLMSMLQQSQQIPMHPVWLDPAHPYASKVLTVLHQSQTVTHYSPLLQDAGVACCVLASAWLIGGWLQGAFLTRNTLDCSTQRALNVTAKAWMVACVIMLYVVATTSWLNDAILQTPLGWNGFTKGDADYILDSLIVIGLWRWLASNLMGSGGHGDGKSH